jgi:hypothetical protein
MVGTDGAAVEADLLGRALGCPACQEVTSPAAAAAARAAGQAVAVCHMGAHALGAAAYAAKAAVLGDPDRPGAVEDEIRWQLDHLSAEVRAALRALPPVGQNSSGPLGPGLLSRGQLGMIVRDLQAGLARLDRYRLQAPEPDSSLIRGQYAQPCPALLVTILPFDASR